MRRVLYWLKKNSFEYEIRDERPIPASTRRFETNSGWKLRPYQQEAIDAAERPRGVYEVSVGGGKTCIAAFIIKKKGVDTLFVTPDTGLREQTCKTFYDIFEDSSLISKDIKSDAPIIVSNIQALVKKPPALFERFGMLILDEVHHSSASTYLKLNKMVSNAYYRYGLSGTWMRTDGTDMTMHGVLSDVIFTKSASELIEEGWLVRPYITFTSINLKGWSRLNYRAAYDRIILDVGFNTHVSRIANTKIKENKQTLVLVRRKEHGELLNQMIEDSSYICGDHPVEERERVKRDFLEKRIPCLIATNIFGEGIDIPSIDVLVNARLQKTEIQTVQGAGRALRKTPGKERAEIFDFLISGQRNLAAHSKERLETYRKEPAFKISVIPH
jgi:superfamily II DNA or RNA helicase